MSNGSTDKINKKNYRIIWTDYKTNIEIANELNITPVLDKIQEKLFVTYKQIAP
jgi:hypothetical protein